MKLPHSGQCNPCTNPISIKVGTLSKNAIETKNCNLLNHWNFYLTDKSTEKTFSVFSVTNLIVFCKYKNVLWSDKSTFQLVFGKN